MKKVTAQSGKHITAKPKVTVAVPPATVPDTVTAMGAEEQRQVFDEAISRFRAGEFAPALKLFVSASGGPIREMAHVARMHARICEQRLTQAAPAPSNAEEHYNLGVALLNQGEPVAAEKHFQAALNHAPGGDHIHYALALTHAQRGDAPRVYENLKRAIQLHPRNRAQALSDPDLTGWVRHPQIAALLRGPKEGGA